MTPLVLSPSFKNSTILTISDYTVFAMLMAIPFTLLKKSVRGYQTQINRALRELMKDEMKEEKKTCGE